MCEHVDTIRDRKGVPMHHPAGDPAHRRDDALAQLNGARRRQADANSSYEASDPLTEQQLLADDDVEDAERELDDATRAWVRSEETVRTGPAASVRPSRPAAGS